MPLSYAKVRQNEATVSIAIYGETLTVVYYPSQVTDDIFVKFAGFDGINSASAAKEALAGLNEMLSQLIKKWDFYEDDQMATMWPTTVEGLSRLELSLKMQVMFAIMSDVRPNPSAPKTKN